MASSFEYKDSYGYGVALLLVLVAWWLDVLAVRVLLGVAAAILLAWPHLHRWFKMTFPMTIVLICAVGVATGIVWQIFWYGAPWKQGRLSETTPAAEQGSAAAMAQLAGLGWTVRPSPTGLMFEINATALPPMEQSAMLFRKIAQPFTIHFQQPSSISGLHYLAGIPNFTKLDIGAGEFTDISELRSLVQLKSLIISQLPLHGSGTVDPAPLADLTNLDNLSLGMSRVRDSSFLARLIHLKTVYLGQTFISDISPLSGALELETLDIRGTRAVDLGPLANKEHLKELSVGEEQLAGLGALAHLKRLQRLSLISQSPFNLTEVGKLTNLTSLFIWGPSVGSIDVAPLQHLINIRELTVTAGGFNTISTIANANVIGKLINLRTLTLGQLSINDITFLSSLKQLTQLNLYQLLIVSIAPLMQLKQLHKISLNMLPVSDITPLLALPSLTDVTIGRTPARSDVIEDLRRRGVNVTTF